MENLKEYLLKNKKYIILLFIILVSIGCNIYQYLINKKNIEAKQEVSMLTNQLDTEEPEEKNIYQIDIKGEVNKPGTYKIEEDKRVIDAINLAGGLTKNADTKVNNLTK